MKKNIFPFFIILTLALAGYVNTQTIKPKLKINKQNTAINMNEELIKLVSAGQSRMLADFLWIVTLIESDIEHYRKKNLNSWLYLRFNSIIRLDPQFYRAYLFGGQYLSIVKDDLLGAKDIYIRALQKFPNDYKILFNSAFLFAFELKDYEQAIPIYEKLIQFPQAPSYFVSLLHKLKVENKSLKLEDVYKLSLIHI